MASGSGDPGGESDARLIPLNRPGYCNAYNPKTGNHCGQPEGRGTDYRIGPCRSHGGRLPRVRRRAAEETFAMVYAGKIMFGQKIDTDPAIGILEVIGYYMGLVEYLRAEILAQGDEQGRVPLSVAADNIKLWMTALDRLASACKMAGDLKVEMIKTDLITAYQDRVLGAIEGVLTGAGLDADDPKISALVLAQLALVAGPNAA